jgi:hypothetical protein
MPYKISESSKLRKLGKRNRYFVVTIETGKKHSKEPMSKTKAEAQLRILNNALSAEPNTGGALLGKRKAGLLPPRSRALLKKVGNEEIISLKAVRAPILKPVKGFLDLLSLGSFSKALDKLGYDKAFHLALVINDKYTFDKQEVVRFDLKGKEPPEAQYINIRVPPNTTIDQFIEKTRQLMGDKNFSDYNAKTNNCQVFVMSALKANGVLDQSQVNFIKQDAVAIFNLMPKYVEKLAKDITDLGAVGSKLLEGEGLIGRAKTDELAGIKFQSTGQMMTSGTDRKEPTRPNAEETNAVLDEIAGDDKIDGQGLVRGRGGGATAMRQNFIATARRLYDELNSPSSEEDISENQGRRLRFIINRNSPSTLGVDENTDFSTITNVSYLNFERGHANNMLQLYTNDLQEFDGLVNEIYSDQRRVGKLYRDLMEFRVAITQNINHAQSKIAEIDDRIDYLLHRTRPDALDMNDDPNVSRRLVPEEERPSSSSRRRVPPSRSELNMFMQQQQPEPDESMEETLAEIRQPSPAGKGLSRRSAIVPTHEGSNNESFRQTMHEDFNKILEFFEKNKNYDSIPHMTTSGTKLSVRDLRKRVPTLINHIAYNTEPSTGSSDARALEEATFYVTHYDRLKRDLDEFQQKYGIPARLLSDRYNLLNRYVSGVGKERFKLFKEIEDVSEAFALSAYNRHLEDVPKDVAHLSPKAVGQAKYRLRRLKQTIPEEFDEKVSDDLQTGRGPNKRRYIAPDRSKNSNPFLLLDYLPVELANQVTSYLAYNDELMDTLREVELERQLDNSDDEYFSAMTGLPSTNTIQRPKIEKELEDIKVKKRKLQPASDIANEYIESRRRRDKERKLAGRGKKQSKIMVQPVITEPAPATTPPRRRRSSPKIEDTPIPNPSIFDEDYASKKINAMNIAIANPNLAIPLYITEPHDILISNPNLTDIERMEVEYDYFDDVIGFLEAKDSCEFGGLVNKMLVISEKEKQRDAYLTPEKYAKDAERPRKRRTSAGKGVKRKTVKKAIVGKVKLKKHNV